MVKNVDTSNKAKKLNLPIPQAVIPIDHSNAIIKTNAATQILMNPKSPAHPNYTPKTNSK